MSNELKSYIKECLGKGYSVEEIKEKLSKAKHKDKDIEFAFLAATMEYDKSLVQTELANFRKIMIVLAILLFMVILLLIARM